MANTPKRLYVGKPAATGTLYAVPAGAVTIVKNILLCNTTGTAATVDVYLVPTGQTATASNAIIFAYSIKPNDTISVDVSAVMQAGDTLQAKQGTAGAINMYASGVEMA